jgi:hypothetical protein
MRCAGAVAGPTDSFASIFRSFRDKFETDATVAALVQSASKTSDATAVWEQVAGAFSLWCEDPTYKVRAALSLIVHV